ncbi:MAG: hypothetical protein R2939_19700 [Kofleriaceae bacterium]
MNYLGPLALIAAAILAISSLIIAKKPEAKALIDKLVPYQGFLGVGLLAVGVLDLVRGLDVIKLFMKFWPLGGAIVLGAIISEILLGILFGIPQIVAWIPGESSAEDKAMQIQKKIAGFSVLIGIIGLACAIGVLLIQFGVLKPGV